MSITIGSVVLEVGLRSAFVSVPIGRGRAWSAFLDFTFRGDTAAGIGPANGL